LNLVLAKTALVKAMRDGIGVADLATAAARVSEFSKTCFLLTAHLSTDPPRHRIKIAQYSIFKVLAIILKYPPFFRHFPKEHPRTVPGWG
jgi:hypothetical protein